MNIEDFKKQWIIDNEEYFVNTRTGDVMIKFAKDWEEQLLINGVVGRSEQLKCDNCKCTPTVIHNTPSGRFCEACRPVTL